MKAKSKKKAVRRRKRTGSSELDRLIADLERIEEYLKEEGVTGLQLLPDLDVIMRVARREYDALNPAGTRANQQILKNLVGILAERGTPDPLEARAAALDLANKAIDATEDLGVRSGFFVGLAHGMAWTFKFTEKAEA